MKTEAELCRDQFERTEVGFDRKNETLKGLKESILDVARPARELLKSAIALGFVAAMSASCSTTETESFSVGVNCPEDTSLEVSETEVQGIFNLVCQRDSLNYQTNFDDYSPISFIDLENIDNTEIPDDYDYRLDFDVPYVHQPARDFMNKFTINYDLKPDPVFDNIGFYESLEENGTIMDIGRHLAIDINVAEIGKE